MGRLQLTVGVLLGVVFLPQFAKAGFKNTYSDWKTMGEASQSIYSEGLLDAAIVADQSADGEAFASGMRDCATKLHLTGALMADAITKYYADDTSKWGEPPTGAFWDVIIRGACFSHINNARVNLGLTPWMKN